MLRTTALVLAVASLMTFLAPLFMSGQSAEAGCTRVYTTSGWTTRCS